MDDGVGQFVPVAGDGRKVCGEQSPDLLHRLDEGGRVVALLQGRAEPRTDFLPERVAAFFVDAAIADDGELVGDPALENAG